MKTHAPLVLALAAGLTIGGSGCVQYVPLFPVEPEADAAASVAPSRAPDAAVSCEEIFDFEQESPEVILALDRSTSMWQKYDSSTTTRIDGTQRALRALLATYHDAVHTGYVEFPVSDCSQGGSNGCCASNVIAPGRDSLEAIQKRWRCDSQAPTCQEYEADAPTAAALRNARLKFRDLDEPISTRHLFLLTDSEPSCSARPGTECSQALAEAALLWANETVQTDVFVLAGELATNTCLQSLGSVGVESEGPSPLFHVASTSTALEEQLAERFAALSRRACTFRLRDALRPPETLAVYFGEGANKTAVPQDRSNGWEFEPNSVRRFTVRGPLCEALRTSQVSDVDVELCTPASIGSRDR